MARKLSRREFAAGAAAVTASFNFAPAVAQAIRQHGPSHLAATLGVLVKDRADMYRLLFGDLSISSWAASSP